jgi:pyruvate dehydrogenase E2 component (dihydrolipoamide acetyltransferase)
MGEFRMPSLGADMDRGTVIEWRVSLGDTVRRGDIVAVVDTDKSDIEIEVFEDGIVEELLVGVGEEVPVGTVLARLRSLDGPAAPPPSPPTNGEVPDGRGEAEEREPEPAPGPEPVPARVPVAHRPVALSPIVRHLADELGVDLAAVDGTGAGGRITRHDVERHRAVPAPAARRSDRPPSSPYARRLAGTLDVDLASVTGTGPGGAVLGADVERGARPADEHSTPSAPAVAGSPASPSSAPLPSPPAAPAAAETPPRRDRAAAQRAATAQLMARSKREIPHYYLRTDIDLDRARRWLDETNPDRPVSERLLLSVLLLKAAALAAREVPDLNGHWVDGSLHRLDDVDLGVAVSLRGGGLVAPAIHRADARPVAELMAELRDLVARARSGRMRATDLTDPSITVTSLGEQGAREVYGVIYPPQVAIVGFGRVTDRPWADQGMLTVRPAVTATLAADHRVTSGHEGSQYLAALDRRLQEPNEL